MLLLALSILISLATCQEITTNSCDSSKGCLKMPPTCTSSTNCDFLMTYRRRTNDANIMEFEVSSRHGGNWIALGFNPASTMAGTRGEICYLPGGSGIFQGFHATGYFPPNYQTPATGTVLSGVSLVNGAIVCRFSRPVQPSGYQGSLGPSIHPIFATGLLGTNGSPSRHSHRVVGNLMDLTIFRALQTTTKMTSTAAATTTPALTTTTSMMTTAATTTPALTTTASMTTTVSNARMTPITNTTNMPTENTVKTTATTFQHSMTSSASSSTSAQNIMSTTAGTTTTRKMQMFNSTQFNMKTTTYAPMSQMIDLTQCGKSKGCYRVPKGCAMNSCKYIVTWKPDYMKKEVQIEISSMAKGWVAFGLNKQAGNMAGTHGEICYRHGASSAIKGFHAIARITPTFTSVNAQNLQMSQVMLTNGALTCKYTRKFTAISSLSIDLNQDLYITLASGDSVSVGGIPAYHGSNRYSSNMKYNIAMMNTSSSPTGMASRSSSSVSVLVVLGIISLFGQFISTF